MRYTGANCARCFPAKPAVARCMPSPSDNQPGSPLPNPDDWDPLAASPRRVTVGEALEQLPPTRHATGLEQVLPRAVARPPATSSPRKPVPKESLPRTVVEIGIALSIAVILFRTFLVEGYMVTTGSMAPTILGFHKRVVCPSCGFEFGRNVPWNRRESREEAEAQYNRGDMVGKSGLVTRCVCPNCGEERIDISKVPRNQGDQLLVQKHFFGFRPPLRWEPAVFRNPHRTTQVFVKRVVGLPGETILVRDGDVYADGQLCRKPLDRQRSMAINVYDNAFRPLAEDGWQPRWQPDEGWQEDHGEFHSRPESWQPGEWSWVEYRHWLRDGGTHQTSIEVPLTEEMLAIGDTFRGIRFDAATRQLTCIGVMEPDVAGQLRAISSDPAFLAAVDQLALRSHVAPIVDWYGYNDPGVYRDPTRPEFQPVPVRDILWTATIQASPPVVGRASQFAVEMNDGASTFRLVIDFLSREVVLRDATDGLPGEKLRETVLSAERFGKPMSLEMSLIDRQVLVAVDKQVLFDAWLLDELPAATPPTLQPVRFGSRGVSMTVMDLRLKRDVYYRDVEENRPCLLGGHEYFVLGDNSPVSDDSRKWVNPAVPDRLFLGKPFVVHLPSQQLKLTLNGKSRYIRAPDFSRVRFIR